MSRFNITLEAIQEEEEIDRVISWLEDMHFGSDSEQDKVEPATPPPKRPFHEQSFNEVSPTDTTFSGGSVFDKPYCQNLLLGSPGPYHDDISDVTSVDGEEREPIKQPIFQSSHLPAHAADVTDKTCLPDPNAPRLTTILSCIQCTLANLPCSRTPPACTRCTRNATPSCLLQRRLFSDEIAAAPTDLCTQPVLLKLVSESEEVWEKKMGVMQELMGEWRDRKDRENWVLPKVETSVRRGWRG